MLTVHNILNKELKSTIYGVNLTMYNLWFPLNLRNNNLLVRIFSLYLSSLFSAAMFSVSATGNDCRTYLLFLQRRSLQFYFIFYSILLQNNNHHLFFCYHLLLFYDLSCTGSILYCTAYRVFQELRTEKNAVHLQSVNKAS